MSGYTGVENIMSEIDEIYGTRFSEDYASADSFFDELNREWNDYISWKSSNGRDFETDMRKEEQEYLIDSEYKAIEAVKEREKSEIEGAAAFERDAQDRLLEENKTEERDFEGEKELVERNKEMYRTKGIINSS